MNDDLKASLRQDRGQVPQVILMRMNAAGRQKSQQVYATRAGFGFFDEGRDSRIGLGRTVFESLGHSGQGLHDHATRADVQVTNLGVANLAVRKAHVRATCGQPRGRKTLHHGVKVGRLGQNRRVEGLTLPNAPAIKNDQPHWIARHLASPFK